MEICQLICRSIGVDPALVRKLSFVIEVDESVLITVEFKRRPRPAGLLQGFVRDVHAHQRH